MKISIILVDDKFDNVNLSAPYQGNPGIGGTEYEFSMLIYYLGIHSKIQKVNVYHKNEKMFSIIIAI